MLDQRLEHLNKTDDKWSLADDSQLCTLLDALNKSMQNRLDAAAKALESLDRNTVEAANAVSQLNNRLDFYASKKFIESRVCDDCANEPSLVRSTMTKTELERQEEAVQSVKEALFAGFRMMENKFKRIDTNMKCFDEEGVLEGNEIFCSEPVFEPYDPHLSRPLPLIIGTSEWTSSPSAGLCEAFTEQRKESGEDDIIVGIPSVEPKKDNEASSATTTEDVQTTPTAKEPEKTAKEPSKEEQPVRRTGKLKLDAAFAAKIGAGPAEEPEPHHFTDSCSQGVDSLFTDSESDDDIFGESSIPNEIKQNASLSLLNNVAASKSLPLINHSAEFPSLRSHTKKFKDAVDEAIKKDISSPKNLFSSDSSDDLEDDDDYSVLSPVRKKPIALPKAKSQNPEFKNMLAGVINVKPKPKPKPRIVVQEDPEPEPEPESEETKAETGFHLTKTRMKRPGKRLPKRYQAKYEKALAEEKEQKKAKEIKPFDQIMSPEKHSSELKPEQNLLFPDSEDDDIFHSVSPGLSPNHKSDVTDKSEAEASPTKLSRQAAKSLFETDSEDDLFKEAVEGRKGSTKDSDNDRDVNESLIEPESSSRDVSFHDAQYDMLTSEEDAKLELSEPNPQTPFFEAE